MWIRNKIYNFYFFWNTRDQINIHSKFIDRQMQIFVYKKYCICTIFSLTHKYPLYPLYICRIYFVYFFTLWKIVFLEIYPRYYIKFLFYATFALPCWSFLYNDAIKFMDQWKRNKPRVSIINVIVKINIFP